MNILESGYPSYGTDFLETIEYYQGVFTAALKEKCYDLSSKSSAYKALCDAITYSLEAGGKRIRPILVLEFCRVCGGNISDALPAAVAIEMIHTFSLIHDDLPCMDDDDFRRGRPSCHKAFGEATALLAGDALSFIACETISKSIKPNKAMEMISVLCDCSYRMIGGQTIDIESKFDNFDDLVRMYDLKTSQLIKAACVMGCIAGDADNVKKNAAAAYAYNLGIGFQIIDDILDVTSDVDVLGKPVGSDASMGKTTCVTLLGIETAQQKADDYTKEALSLLSTFENNSFLTELTDMLLRRKN